MKTRKIQLLLIGLAFVACGERSGQAGADDPATAQLAAAPVSEEEAVAIGDSAAAALTMTLMGQMRAKVEESGPAEAVEFCSEEALPLTAQVEDGVGRGISVKRTSNRVRNPANAPDSLELLALAYFEAEKEKGQGMPGHYLQRTEDGWRYYKPISVAPLCTRCHGPVESIDPEVRTVLRERYPEDRATGYTEGDFRGVVRVSIPAPQVR